MNSHLTVKESLNDLYIFSKPPILREELEGLKNRLEHQVLFVSKFKVEDLNKLNLHLAGVRHEILTIKRIIEDLEGGRYATYCNQD